MAQVQPGDLVQAHYTGSLADGTVFDSSEGKDPLSFTAGGNELISGVSQGVIGMSEGESKTITVEPADGYGERQDQLVQQIPLESLPDDVEVGSVLVPSNQPEMHLIVTEIADQHAVVDGNHPLAGRTLVFEVEIVSVTTAPS